jgi:hypothetical protein
LIKLILLTTGGNTTIFPNFCTSTSIAYFVEEKTVRARVRYGLTINISHIGLGSGSNKRRKRKHFVRESPC